jgi:O-antigen/teichoic acid export membrane protein
MNVKSVYVWNYLQRIINAIGGILLVTVIAVFYDLDEAGGFYALYSLLGLVVIFEFGYAVLIVQRISVYSNTDFTVLNRERSKALLHYLAVVKYFIVFFVLVFPYLAYLILEKVVSDVGIMIIPLTLLIALNMLLSMIGNFIEGLGHIEKISKVRTFQAFFTYGALLGALLFGFGALAIAFQLIFQVGVFLVLIIQLLRQEFSSLLPVSSFFKFPNYSDISKDIFRVDSKYAFQLYVTILAGLFSNQLWVIAITVNGAVENISKVAMVLQIVTAAAGFALTPAASRLAQIAKYQHVESNDKTNVLIRKITKDVILSTSFSVVMITILYYIGDFYYGEKMVSALSAFLFISSLPLLVATSLIGIIVQSRGKSDIVWVSIARIIIPSILFFYINPTTTDLNISIYYFVSILAAFLISIIYLIKRIR